MECWRRVCAYKYSFSNNGNWLFFSSQTIPHTLVFWQAQKRHVVLTKTFQLSWSFFISFLIYVNFFLEIYFLKFLILNYFLTKKEYLVQYSSTILIILDQYSDCQVGHCSTLEICMVGPGYVTGRAWRYQKTNNLWKMGNNLILWQSIALWVVW